MPTARLTLTKQARLAAASIAAALVSLFAASPTETAIANGDTRTLSLYHTHTGESIEATFRVNGAYDPAALAKLNYFLRDWRNNDATRMDPRLFDVVWEVYRTAGAAQPIHIVSAYRSPETNAMLRARSRAVAEFSQHILGKAMDTTMPGMSMQQIREVGMRLQRGGVGYYSGQNFVHLDVGSVRYWPRMSYDQLARLFPDGKAVFLAADGRALPRYEEARADISARGGGVADAPAPQGPNLFSWLFGARERDRAEEAIAAREAAPGRGPQVAAREPPAASPAASPTASPTSARMSAAERRAARAAAAAAPAVAAIEAANAPDQPAGRTQVAAFAPAQSPIAVPLPTPRPPAEVAAKAPADVGKDAAIDSAKDAGKDVPRDRIGQTASLAPLPPARPASLAALASPAAVAAPATPAYADAPAPPSRPVQFAALAPQGGAAAAPAKEAAAQGEPAKAEPAQAEPARAAPSKIELAKAELTRVELASVEPARIDPAAPLARAASLPVVITRGPKDQQALPARALSYAGGGFVAASRRATTPGAPAPEIVSARLDRSNYSELTSARPTAEEKPASALGQAVTGLRLAARIIPDALSAAPSTSYKLALNAASGLLDCTRFTKPAAATAPASPSGVSISEAPTPKPHQVFRPGN